LEKIESNSIFLVHRSAHPLFCDPMTQRDKLINDLQAFLEYKKEEGFQTLEISPETLVALKPTASAPAQKTMPTAQKPVPKLARPMPVAAAPKPPKSAVQVTGKTLDEIAGQIRTCAACPLHTSRQNTVPGEGNPNQPDILFVSDFPGVEEDEQGRFYTSEAGQLLEKMIVAMGYKRDTIFILNLVQCRPPNNRVPLPEEVSTCNPYLKAQIALVQPKLIVALGKTAVEGLLHEKVAITRLRGTWKTYEGIDLMPTFHPGYLLKVPAKKREVWADLQAVLAKLGKTHPAKK